MPIATFANKIFEVNNNKVYTFADFQYASTLDTEKQDAAGQKPSTYNKGPGLDNFSIKLKLRADLGVNPRNDLGEWLAIKDAGIAYPFILGGTPFRPNKWLLVDVQASDEQIDNLGNVLSLTISLKFDEYVRPGSSSQSKSGKAASKKTAVGLTPADYKPAALTPAEKEQLK